MRVGLFGGTFDPVHFGHLLVAETCRESARLDEIWFVPAATSPHKLGRQPTGGQQRLQMLRLAIAGHPDFEVCDLEVVRGGVSYTVATLETLRRQHPDVEMFLLMGADALVDFLTWRDPARICELAIPLVVHRPDSPQPDLDRLATLVTPERLAEIRQAQVEMPLIDLSSSDIRRRVQEGRSIRFRTPRAVAMFIQAHQLYQAESS
jgi:nicotinate-nucleotide adenylyltransferase